MENTPTIKKNGVFTVPLIINVHCNDPMLLLSLGLNYKNINLDEIFLDLNIKASSAFGISKKKEFKKISLAQLLKLNNKNKKDSK